MRIRILLFVFTATAALLMGACSGDGGSSDGGPTASTSSGSPANDNDDNESVSRTAQPQQGPLPYSTSEDFLTVNYDGTYRPFFIKAMTLGVGVPGTAPGDLAATRQQYERWLNQIRESGFNTVRVYDLHFPRFYEALDAHNRAHPQSPLYLLQGTLFAESANQEGDLYNFTADFTQNLREMVDCLHGNCSIATRENRGYGDYQTDVSRWTLGWIIGREVYPNEIIATNNAHPGDRSFFGEAFRVRDGGAVEVWYAEHLDRLVRYERETYNTQRPVSVLTWPTLDPITHETEGSDNSNQDIAEFDPSLIEIVEAPGGLFATYHAYPYYPNFIVDDPGYRQFADAQGPNSYLGYLTDLRRYHSQMPVFVGETGASTSWGNAHFGYSGMNHGGHDETEQGVVNARIMRTAASSGMAGAAFFGWVDEWWKTTWITTYVDFPAQNRQNWHNVTTPEQNFGMIAFDPPEPDFNQFGAVGGQPPVSQMRSAVGNAYFHLELEFERALTAQDQITIGFDTYRDDLGEVQLPDGALTQNRNEFALTIQPGEPNAAYQVTQAYDLFGRRFNNSAPEQQYRSTPTNGAPWHLMRWQNSAPHGSNDGSFSFAATVHNIGEVGVRNGAEPASSLDAVEIENQRLRVQIPWTMLYFVDPTQRQVVHDDPSNPVGPVETQTSEGIAVSVSVNGSVLFETARFNWPTWNSAPTTTERLKAGFESLASEMRGISNWPEG